MLQQSLSECHIIFEEVVIKCSNSFICWLLFKQVKLEVFSFSLVSTM